jgi:hypothetical protein
LAKREFELRMYSQAEEPNAFIIVSLWHEEQSQKTARQESDGTKGEEIFHSAPAPDLGGNLHIALAVVFDLKCSIARTVYLAAKLHTPCMKTACSC